jgi:hypothetical protein
MKKMAAFLILLLASQAQAAENQKMIRPATRQDLVGTWDVVAVRPVKDPKDPAFFPHQRYLFKSDSSMKFMASPVPFDAESEKKFLKEPTSIDYTINEKGVLTLSWQARPYTEAMIAGVVIQEPPTEALSRLSAEQRRVLPQKGDLTFSYMSDGKPAFQKVLKKIA